MIESRYHWHYLFLANATAVFIIENFIATHVPSLQSKNNITPLETARQC